jgi:beta-1,2-mannobiose phosphorylase / 1,2-beta-oligomannan phosphorylase
MKLERYEGNPILEKNPKNEWEAGSVLNPGVIIDNGIFRMVYRAINDVDEVGAGKFVSSIGYAQSTDGINFVRAERPLIKPDQVYEMGKGCEDPRVTKINDTYFLYYTAVASLDKYSKKSKGVRIALATSKDFKNWTKHGIVGPDLRSKAAVLFPELIKEKYVWFYTLEPDRPGSSIMQVRFDSVEDVINPPKGLLESNVKYYSENVVIQPSENSTRGPEVGAVPVRTKDGWLMIYCMDNNTGRREWVIGAALLDLDDPKKIIGITDKPILEPEMEAEMIGVESNVVFPEGAVVVGEDLFIYYGSADQGINLATCKIDKLTQHLNKNNNF